MELLRTVKSIPYICPQIHSQAGPKPGAWLYTQPRTHGSISQIFLNSELKVKKKIAWDSECLNFTDETPQRLCLACGSNEERKTVNEDPNYMRNPGSLTTCVSFNKLWVGRRGTIIKTSRHGDRVWNLFPTPTKLRCGALLPTIWHRTLFHGLWAPALLYSELNLDSGELLSH